jgi:putative ABC transport system permease protein
MNVITRGFRNAFRNNVRTFSIVIILSLSIALALSMVLARGAVERKIESVKTSIGNTVTVVPAGIRGFEGGGEPLTAEQITSIKGLAHISNIVESLSDRLSSDNTSLKSAIDAGSLGERFKDNSGFRIKNPDAMTFQAMPKEGTGEKATLEFTPPISISASTDLSVSDAAKDGTVMLSSGAAFDANSAENVALVGKSLAEKNSLKVGSTFTAYGAEIKVVGVYDTGNTFTDNAVVMPLKTLQKLSNQEGQLSSATVKVDSIINVNGVVAALKNKLGDKADVTSQQSEAEEALVPLENIKTISLFSLVGAVIAGSAIILLTMVMIVRERRREIGVLKAIGASNIRVMSQFMTEAITLTIIAAVIGIALGVIGGNPITKVLVNNSSSTNSNSTNGRSVGGGAVVMERGSTDDGPKRLNETLGLSKQNLKDVHAVVGWDILLYGLGSALLIAVAGSAAAALLIAKIRPAEVMRVE